RAIRRISIERGHDPRAYTLVAFGGAAGMHACALAEGLGIARALIPFQPGLLSAFGAVSSNVQRDYVQTVRLRDPRSRGQSRRLTELRRRAPRDIQREHIGTGRPRMTAFVDCRYPGQSFEIRVPMRASFARDFHAAHQRLYGYANPG